MKFSIKGESVKALSFIYRVGIPLNRVGFTKKKKHKACVT